MEEAVSEEDSSPYSRVLLPRCPCLLTTRKRRVYSPVVPDVKCIIEPSSGSICDP